MLTFQQMLKSKTVWASVLLVAGPEVYQLVMSNPDFTLPESWHRALHFIGAVAVILFRAMNQAGDEPKV